MQNRALTARYGGLKSLKITIYDGSQSHFKIGESIASREPYNFVSISKTFSFPKSYILREFHRYMPIPEQFQQYAYAFRAGQASFKDWFMAQARVALVRGRAVPNGLYFFWLGFLSTSQAPNSRVITPAAAPSAW
jgi:hypothetical protein